MLNFTDNKGRWIGSVTETAGRKTYTDATGRVTARVMDGKTFDAKGKVVTWSGDQGMRTLGKK